MCFQLKFFSILIIFFLSLAIVANDKKLELSGNLIQGGLVYGETAPGSKVKFNQHWVRVSSNGTFILGFGRNFPEHADLIIYSAAGSKSVYKLKIKLREYKIQRIDGLPDDKVNPDEKALQRIRKEQAEIAKARDIDDARQDYLSGFIWPVQGPITGVYGSQRILNGQARQPHYGVDIAAPSGNPVAAPAAGIVTYVNPDMYFSGGTLVLDHGHNLSSSFLHLQKILVKVGDVVEQGQTIALVGATGRVTGAHLDWRMNWREQRLDPALIMGDTPIH